MLNLCSLHCGMCKRCLTNMYRMMKHTLSSLWMMHQLTILNIFLRNIISNKKYPSLCVPLTSWRILGMINKDLFCSTFSFAVWSVCCYSWLAMARHVFQGTICDACVKSSRPICRKISVSCRTGTKWFHFEEMSAAEITVSTEEVKTELCKGRNGGAGVRGEMLGFQLLLTILVIIFSEESQC